MSFLQKIEINSLSFPLGRPFSNHVRFITEINGIDIRITTSTGIVGHGFIYGLGIIAHQDTIKHIENDLIPALFKMNEIIQNAEDLHHAWNQFWIAYRNDEKNLIQEKLYSLASIDIALWDIFTKSKSISLHHYLGNAQSKIPVYGTTGWLSLSQNELIEECNYYIARQVKAFKVRIGHKDDYVRLKSLRAAVGDDVKLMLDANQRYSVAEATEVSQKLAEFNIFWIEEPTNNVLSNIEAINRNCSLPIALGENILTEKDFEIICEKRLASYLQPDVPRCGGITGFRRFADIALKYNIPICNHLLYELSASLIAAYQNGFMLEYDNFLPPNVFTHDYSVLEGCINAPSEIGNGVEVSKEALDKYCIDSITHELKMIPCNKFSIS